jgi:death-on-curing protein
MPGVRDQALLEAAVVRPRQLFAYEHPSPTLARLAAAYGYSIIRNHPFVDGNKRTGLIALRLFLALNGRELLSDPIDKFKFIVATAAGNITEEELVAWVAAHCR